MPPKYTPAEAEASFWSKVDRSGGDDACWPWTAARTAFGYGTTWWRGEAQRAHRVAWAIAIGPIPDGLHVCHSCDDPPCCNPAHLWLGTAADNAADRDRKGRTGAARGDAHGARLHPERLARGDRSGARLHPERLARGEANGSAKLDEAAVREIRRRHAQGESAKALGRYMGVSGFAITCVVTRKTWGHVLPLPGDVPPDSGDSYDE